ncbi:MAG: hypothetical protein ABW250_26845 [Pyrinomonadaceae bacterium]
MAIFSRRTIQCLINENAKFLKERQTKEFVRRLNDNDELLLGWEWEIAILNAFSRLGKVVHEPKLKGTNPDIYFTSHTDPDQSFIADIATVSDRGLDENYPVEALSRELMQYVHQRGLRGNSFALFVRSTANREVRGTARRIFKLPTRLNFNSAIFNEKFHAFLDEIERAPNVKRGYRAINEDTVVDMVYNPSQSFSLTSHPSYSLITSLVQNTVYNRLEGKAGKLINSGSNYPLGIIICDGGCSLFNQRSDLDSYGFSDVLRYFFEQYPAISFVLTFTFRDDATNGIEIKDVLYKGKTFNRVGEDVVESISKIKSALPKPERNATNAVYFLDFLRNVHSIEGHSFYGGYTVGSHEITISARALLDLLSGKVTQEQFFKKHHFMPDEGEAYPSFNPFTYKREKGMLITEITVEENEDERDDNWLTIKFGEPDPAITPFVVPTKE